MSNKFAVVESPTGKLKQVKIGYSYTTLIFGSLPDLFRGNFLNAFLTFTLSLVVSIILNLNGLYELSTILVLIIYGIYASVRNERLLDSYMKKGWTVKDVFIGG